MRNYVRTRGNLYKLQHNTYMQMFYLIKDYDRYKQQRGNQVLSFLAKSIDNVICELACEYAKRPVTYGKLDSLRAYESYEYFSYMFARKQSEYGASKSAWSLYRSKFAYLLAEKLNLI